MTLTPAQLSVLLEGIDWRTPARTWQPEMAVSAAGCGCVDAILALKEAERD